MFCKQIQHVLRQFLQVVERVLFLVFGTTYNDNGATFQPSGFELGPYTGGVTAIFRNQHAGAALPDVLTVLFDIERSSAGNRPFRRNACPAALGQGLLPG